MPNKPRVVIVGGGLAGCECALALARYEIPVTIVEQKPERFSPAHRNADLAELVCSNSLRSADPTAAVGELKTEMTELGSAVMDAADETRVPAGKALAVDREHFAAAMTRRIEDAPNVTLERRHVPSLDEDTLQQALDEGGAVVIAAGPLASESLSESIAAALGAEHLYFYDAIAPIVAADSLNMDICFRASRYGADGGDSEDGDYLNCPMTETEYDHFVEALLAGEKAPCREFEKEIHFEGCMPVEALAERGRLTLAYGSFKPVGLVDPRTGEQPFAVIQLRAENREGGSYNLVGCQTKLTYPEQKRIFRLVPGLENAEFERMGSVHRNTFVNSPRVLSPRGDLLARPGVYLAGQITGVEGYVESAAHGLWAGHSLGARLAGLGEVAPPPETTVLGALLAHLQRETKNFQPSNGNFGLTPALNRRAPKRKRKELYAQRAREDYAAWLQASSHILRLGS
ncbi:methylenetetrahydrofolate--tRNA-(uracil(54)-C(5))-methyltransferase (FADH(2)-oxidizing) TrmFO [Oceanidesulfovibrio indonesiensis]|uniref:Methylenetetrahydrofolate--tRNA-(uracil-5-)-methyltransferase TrmFO n=1 Tax=Oceanidesulfovibrio indonesiensis TaxID=54767 RepID=A0A7M3MI31_9BACT|nr:methylenetetrahydrofolate--tRNA-(uracil(54)-C(5))-methyltransferase (FADH(2)-oxidizing) TrmFO [Oceanidesulfovibrio indonesiensis]TVM19352.1 methylenetetrahydrofolate--tRNA-(uracil(54)-C(5))-methyltransferase (FADH(2)-oxidizing) TrmFO [Oceanidesulfovibrio indonesiensis]